MLVLIPPMSVLQASQHSNINLSCLARPSSILKSPGVSYEHLAVTVAMPAACLPAAVSSGAFLRRADSPGQLKWHALNAIPGHRQLLGALQIEVAAAVLESPVTVQHGNNRWATVYEFVPEGFHHCRLSNSSFRRMKSLLPGLVHQHKQQQHPTPLAF
jgi:hypothetical protein